MRTDIKIHIGTGDVAMQTVAKSVLYPFRWVENPSGLARYIYGEITVPASMSGAAISKGIACRIPYTAKCKEFCIRIGKKYGGDEVSYIQNPVDGSEWFLVKVNGENAIASELIKYSEDFEYVLLADKGSMKLYSNGIQDFEIGNANRQNMNLMLVCNPTNNYRYPLAGVGTTNWVNGKSINSEMIGVLRDEFSGDGTPVISAEYDFDTKKLNMQLNTSGVD